MDVFQRKNKRYRKQLTKLGGDKVLSSRPSAAIFVMSFANFKSRVLSCDPLGDRMMPRTKVHITAQASHENITVLSHLEGFFHMTAREELFTCFYHPW